MKDEIILLAENDGVDVQNLTANFKLCSDTEETCALCLVIDTEFHIRLDNDMEDEGSSGDNEEEDRKEERNPKGKTGAHWRLLFPSPRRLRSHLWLFVVVERISMKLGGSMWHASERNWSNFGLDPDWRMDPITFIYINFSENYSCIWIYKYLADWYLFVCEIWCRYI